MGVNFAALKDYKSAIKYYNQALSIDPNNTMVLFNLGNNYKQQEEYIEALNYYNKALKQKGNGKVFINLPNTNPRSLSSPYNFDIEASAILFQRGITYLCLDSIKSSIEDFDKCIYLHYNLPESHYYLGINFLTIGQDELACVNLRKSYLLGDKEAKEVFEEYCK